MLAVLRIRIRTHNVETHIVIAGKVGSRHKIGRQIYREKKISKSKIVWVAASWLSEMKLMLTHEEDCLP